MRKKTISNLAEHIMWGIILLLPLLMWLISPLGYSIGGGSDVSSLDLPSLTSIFEQFGLYTNNVIYNSFADLFGPNGILPFFITNSAFLLYAFYFVMVEVLHLVIDCLVFIPRLAHKWLNKCTLEIGYEDK